MPSSAGQKARTFVPALTGIRAVAALWVLVGHYSGFLLEYFHFPRDSILEPLFRSPYAGVDLFFILSGFIIAYTYSSSFLEQGLKSSPGFWWKRFARIYPVYLLMTLIAGGMFAVAFAVGHQFRHDDAVQLDAMTVVTNVLGIQTWVDLPSLDGPAWSVSAEFFAYAVFPLIAVVILKVWNRPALFALAFLSVICVFFMNEQHVVPPSVLRVFFGFLMGVILFQLTARTTTVPEVFSSGWFRGAIWTAALVVIYSSGSLKNEAHFALAIISALIVWTYSLQSNNRSLLESRIMVRLGLWSYSLYLVHRVIQNAAAGLHLRSTHVAFFDGLIFLLLLAIALLSAGLVYHFVEEPARKYLNRRPYFSKPSQSSA